jgi:serine/threonine protein kinase
MAPSHFLSRSRLQLITSIFSQICDAVAYCHAQQVFHRDIKPEAIILTNGWIVSSDGMPRKKVLAKLTDFELSTKQVQSCDMDCGSTPYMSHGMVTFFLVFVYVIKVWYVECRNNLGPTYCPRGSDIWSLGIILINM